MRIINDCHIGTLRQAGTTPVSQAALTEYIHAQFTKLVTAPNLAGRECLDLVINGDLFDGFTVDPRELLWTYTVLAEWLEDVREKSLTLVAGNHDWAPKAGKLSSFHLLADLLRHRFPAQVTVVDHTTGLTLLHIGHQVWAIPHMPNQDLFDLELEKALQADRPGHLLLHANYDNNFAVESDHSLNVSQDQAKALIDAGWTLVFAHEHQSRNPMNGLHVVGNQFPTSVSDCLGNERKHYLEFRDDIMHRVECWDRNLTFIDTDWRHLDKDFDGIQFIRVSGNALAEEAEAAINAVNSLRKRSTALVISNAVRVEGLAEMDKLAGLTLEDVSGFDVLGALCAELTEVEAKVVRGLLQ